MLLLHGCQKTSPSQDSENAGHIIRLFKLGSEYI